MESELMHYGVKGMKWGVRKKRAPDHLDYPKKSSATTRKAIDDYNSMDDQTFMNKYSVSKKRYAKRVAKYGDPYMNAPLAKMGKKLEAKQKAKSNQSAKKRGAKAVGKALQIAGALYYTDLALTGGAVTRATAKAGKAAVKRTLNNIGDQMFNYSILDKDGKVLRRYN